MDISTTSAWQALQEHAQQIKHTHIRDLFATDPQRGTSLVGEVGELYIDYSKNLVDKKTLELLFEIAKTAGVVEGIADMFAGKHINTTEDRAVLHTALRSRSTDHLVVDGQDVVADVHEALAKMRQLCHKVHSGQWTGHTNKRINTVVNIGIGGSDLGAKMAAIALDTFALPDMQAYFVSNVDGDDIASVLPKLDWETTIFVVASKTFTTVETITNANTARSWLVELAGDAQAVAKHFVAVSTAEKEVTAFGIDPTNMIGFWDWVGGRYSMDSAVGLSLMLIIGYDNFQAMLDGFYAVDQHLRTQPLEKNVPIILALIALWYRNFLDIPTRAILPYSENIRRFPAFLQQLDMESNGKRVRKDGSVVSYETGPVVWGEPGTNGQHAFYQLIHQGTQNIPADLIGFYHPARNVGQHHDLLMSNIFAQAQALAFGKTAEECRLDGDSEAIVPHKTFPGNHPTTMVLAEKLTPYVLGNLVALYEHEVIVQGIVWGINSFDQWGVQLGKVIATNLLPQLQAEQAPTLSHDSSTNELVRRYRAAHNRANK